MIKTVAKHLTVVVNGNKSLVETLIIINMPAHAPLQ